MSQRFTIDGSNELEAQLAALCERARDELLALLPQGLVQGLLLGGGYGRGEGGVLRTNAGDIPYNDLEFYVFLRGSTQWNERRFGRAIHELGERLTEQASLEVEFKIISTRKLRSEPVSMFYYDLVTGHRCVLGDDRLLAGCDHHRAAHRIPLHEATRLLMNRCSGLLFSAERLQRSSFRETESDFIGRNLAKAKLALGDIILAARGQYHWSCLERHKRLMKAESSRVPHAGEIVTLHEQGVEFKLHPARISKSRDEFLPELEYLKEVARDVWIWLENRRLGTSFADMRTCALAPANKCPEKAGWKSRLINARTFGTRALSCDRYPRERLLRALPLLLWTDVNGLDEETEEYVCEQLAVKRGAAFHELVAAYEQLWRRFN